MRELLTISLLLAAVLLVPVIPFLAVGEQLEAEVTTWFDETLTPTSTALLIAGVLATDILLPVPSSFVSTFGGAQLGVLLAIMASWVGMTFGGMLGFALARWGGRPLANRLTAAGDLRHTERLAARFGPLLIVLTRAVPVLAEASVLLMGATGLSWRRFLVPLVLSNLGIAVAYSVFGRYAAQYDALLPALVASIAVPLLATVLFRLWTPKLANVET